MAGTILSVLIAAYRAGNKQPRGRVVENLKWLAFQASQKKVKGLPAGGTACRVNSFWKEKDYRDLLAGIHPGVTLAELAKVQGRTVGSISARLELLESGQSVLDASDLMAEATERFREAMNAVRVARGLPTTKKA